MKEIQLSKGMVTLVNDKDYLWLNQWTWRARLKGNTWYALRTEQGKEIRMHRFIISALPEEEVHHLDYNGLHNFRSNLKKCTSHEHKLYHAQGSTNFPGVYFDKGRNKYRVELTYKGKRRRLGRFEKLEDAEQAYKIEYSRCYSSFPEKAVMEAQIQQMAKYFLYCQKEGRKKN